LFPRETARKTRRSLENPNRRKLNIKSDCDALNFFL
jgi:hypothetical protein